ncbi:quinol monooxygenase YgiN [Prauserella shujinwangii]|uniref:Quinol monooxygenase YgiN n=2 Tax=Prauserella shujinwangii TaxID=1453103 RepID=A0A2T0LMX0_9PSEU|nr:quinol monooxygenase YgiN [Prauserella shujinwangii]
MPYGHNGSMKVKPGHRDAVVAILLDGVERLRDAGCHLYVVSVSDTDPDTVWVNEVWESAAHHQASLDLPEVKESIGKAMPMLTGEFTGQQLTVVGGLGVPRPT